METTKTDILVIGAGSGGPLRQVQFKWAQAWFCLRVTRWGAIA